MPYYKKRYRRYRRGRRPYRKVVSKGGALSSAWSIAKKAWNAAMYVKSLINVERKFTDLTVSGNPAFDAAVIQHVSLFPQGDGTSNRSGRQLKLKALHMTLRFTTGATPVQQIIRYFIVQKLNDVSGATPTYANIYETATITSYRNMDETKNWKVLLTRTFALDPEASGDEVIHKHNLPLNLRAHYALGTDTPLSGNLWFICVSSQLAAQNPFGLNADFRCVAVDN